jgi:hypothetical protein|tara:strand:+ start:416 stop:769 length:354 start_codon:yes stop_codon:yes gene_type:complete
MEIVIFTIFFSLAIIFAALGLFVEPVNPYMILFGSMILFILWANLITEGVEIPTGDINVNLNMSVTQINGTLTDVQQIPTGIRNTGFNLIVLLLSLYLAFLGIGKLIEDKTGEANVK